MPRPHRRALGLASGAALLIFLGTNVQAGWLFVIAALLLGAVVAGIILPGRMVRGLEVTRMAPAEVHQGDDVRVNLAVTNRTRGMRLGLLVTDPALGGATVALPSMAPAARAEVDTVRRAVRRGPSGTEPVVLRSSAPFGVRERRLQVKVSDGAETLVLPTVIPLGPLAFVRPAATSEQAIHTAPRRGTGAEYLTVREYRPGDSMRHVHWPSTARVGAVMVREFEEEQTRRLAIIVDASWDAGEAWTPLDRVCAAAASVALAAVAQGHGTRLIVPGGDGVDVLARTDGDELLRRLAHVTVDPMAAFPEAVGELGLELRGVETVVVIFPARYRRAASALPEVLTHLSARIPHVVALPVEVTRAESEADALPPGGWTDLEERLRATGAELYPWRADDDLAELLSPDVTTRLSVTGVAP